MTIEAFEAEIRTGKIIADTPVEVNGRWMSASDWPAWGALRESPEAHLHGIWTRRTVPWVTALTLGLIVQVFRLEFAETGEVLGVLTHFPRDTTGILERGEGWRLLTSAFLHGDPAHLLGNAAAIAVAGWALEVMIGHRAMLLVLLGTIVTGNALSTLMTPQVVSIGISGGAFGLLGACIVLGLRTLDLIPAAARAAFGTTAAVFTVWAFLGGWRGEQVDNWCHSGGLLGGLLLGTLYRPRIPAWEGGNRWVDCAALALVAVGVLAPMLAGPVLVPWTPWMADGAESKRPAWWVPEVGRSGLAGYGNSDRSTSLSIDTAMVDHVATPAEVLEEVLATIRRIDAAAEITHHDGERATLTYHTGEEPRVLDLRVIVRGLYVTTAGVDAREAAPFGPRLRKAVLDDLVLMPPDALKDDLAGGSSGSWQAQLTHGVAACSLGSVAEGRTAFALARTHGNPATVDAAEFSVLAALGDVSTPSRIDAALAAFPEDRRLRAAAARARLRFGDRAGAVDLAHALVEDAPSPRSRTSAEALLRELGVPAPPAR